MLSVRYRGHSSTAGFLPEAGLSCLLTEVQYALLMMRSLCIAVFRTRSGRYGFFDPHSRTAKGLPVSLGSVMAGTAVMLTFPHLSDMIDRLMKQHKMMDTHSSSTYELKPVVFYSLNTTNLSNAIQDTHSPPTAQTAAPSAAVLDDAHQRESSRSAPRLTAVVTDGCNKTVHEVCTDMETEPEPLNRFTLNSDTSHDVPDNESNSPAPIIATVVNDSALHDISHKLLKLSRQAKRKYKRRLLCSGKVSQRKENQKRKEKKKYASEKTFRGKKKSYANRQYSDKELRQRKQEHFRNCYRTKPELRQKKRNYITTAYRQNLSFRQKQKKYITSKYRQNSHFREKQKRYMTSKYRQNSHFREKHRQLMRQQMRDRRNNNLIYRSMHKMRCAMKIARKYRQIHRQAHESDREAENPLITAAISVFRSQIKAGPTFCCTVCHKASFPNQVQRCTRSNYVKNPDVVKACLTGKYVHICDDNCRNEQCKVPDERKTEWICHTCHNHLKKGAMPSLAVANNLELADIPSELCDLNILERHLIAKCITFAKIIPLPKGRQQCIRGNVVCVPSQIEGTVNALPRLRSESQVLRVKLKRRLCYRGHQLFQTVTWSKLVQALNKLTQIHPEYKDITIRDEAELCDPTLPDEEDDDDCDDVNVTMEDVDHDEDDLMEIDMCERNALCEAENGPENEVDGNEKIICDERQPEEQNDDPEQEEGNSPVSFFKTPKLEAMAFPVQFPTDDNSVKMSRPMSDLQNTTSESVHVWMTSLTDKYKARPETPEFEKMCMADFASTCRLVYGQQTKGKKVFPLLNDMGYVQKRETDKPAVIRFHRTSQEKHPEQFYGTLLKLYVPYRSDDELKPQFLSTYESFYERGCVQLPGANRPESVKRIVKQNREKYEKNSEEIESAIEEFEQNRGVIDEWCNLAPESEVVRLECIEELEARAPDHENVQEDVPEYAKQANTATEARAIREPTAVDPTLLRQMYQSLNHKQTCVFHAVRDWCIKRVCGHDPEQFFFYINGGAGTGKSHLIKCIYSEASKILCKLPRRAEEADISNPTVLLTAFTGTAAFNISGSTLHSLLKLPRSLKPPFQGLGNKLDEVRSDLLNAEIIVIDEVSMVSKPLFAYVDARLKQIKGSQKPFGGMSVIAVGDFYQLPPVRHSKPLCVQEPLQIDLWRHFKMVTLTEIMRQKDDVVFAEMLNRIRVKDKSDELSEADRAMLSQTITEPALVRLMPCTFLQQTNK
ncbi:uncharacterized protein LOC119017041 [Acanthopagrus latus]|uniref:uncharacterized protein LOC119017041 n=1 Tax=Acanthopagrus latus TaxID=8177 RepID=UPI00187CDD84|nr:uncharacterized protein LOC119017041 [Acanthopagrus latus]